MIAQSALIESSPALKAAVVEGGFIALFIAMKVGQVLIRSLLGLIDLALLGGAAWWFLMRLTGSLSSTP